MPAMNGRWPMPRHRRHGGAWDEQGSRIHPFADGDYDDIDLMVEALHDEEALRLDDVACRRPTHRENRNVRLA